MRNLSRLLGKFIKLPPASKRVIFACGNPSRGDDALGGLLLQRLRELELANTTLIEDFQLQIEHAWDLQGHEQALFIDAHTDCPPPFVFSAIQPAHDHSYSSHALSPSAVLQIYADTWQQTPPSAFVLGIRGYAFDLGAGLSQQAQQNLAAARDWLLSSDL